VVSHWVRADYEPVLLQRGYTADLAGSSLAEVVARGVPRIIGDLEAYLAEHPGSASTALLVREGVRSSMTCPLRVEGRTVGLLFRSSRKASAYDDRQAAIHLAIAERLAQAVEKAWRIEQLTAANRAYFEMLSFVAHELRSPVAAMVMMGRVLTDGHLGPMDPTQKEQVGKMIARGEQLLTIIRDYLDLAWVEGGDLKPEFHADVDFRTAVADPALEMVAPALLQRRMTLTRKADLDWKGIACDPRLLQIVLGNLLSNAVKYGTEGGRVELDGAREPDRLRVSVWNQGPGFSPESRARLFKRFSRLPDKELSKRKGSGVGLFVSWKILQLHGGRIWAESEPGSWARFSFEVPQPIPSAGTAD
jgi:hypothetical protein